MSKAAAIKKFVGSLPDDVKIHLSQKPITAIRAVPQRNKKMGKPDGLWYDCNKEWTAFTDKALGSISRHDHIYLVKPTSKVLRIKNASDMIDFTKNFAAMGPMYAGLDWVDNFSLDMGMIATIDWKKVASRYAGIEICPYQQQFRNQPLTNWYNIWDVASGCIWSPAGMKMTYVGMWSDKEKRVIGKNEVIEMEKEGGLQQPLRMRHDYGTEEGSMLDALEKMHHGEFISREQVASGLVKMAKELRLKPKFENVRGMNFAYQIEGVTDADRNYKLDVDNYTDDQKQQILGQIPHLLRKISDEADDDFSRSIELSRHSLQVIKTHLQDLAWIYGTSGDKRLRKAEIMLKALEKHDKTLEELQTYIRRIAKLVK